MVVMTSRQSDGVVLTSGREQNYARYYDAAMYCMAKLKDCAPRHVLCKIVPLEHLKVDDYEIGSDYSTHA